MKRARKVFCGALLIIALGVRAVGAETGISYDTLRRIKLQLCDPAFSKVQRLAEHFRVVRR